MQLVNLTPHPVNLADADGRIVQSIAPSAMILRLPVMTSCEADINGWPVKRVTQQIPHDLPRQHPGVFYIVSALVASACKRDDFLSPDTGNTAVRDEKGYILAVRGLVRH